MRHSWAREDREDTITVALADTHGLKPLSAATADAVLAYTRPATEEDREAVRATRRHVQARIAEAQAAALDGRASEALSADAREEIATVRTLRDAYATRRLVSMGSDPLAPATATVRDLTSTAPLRTWDQPSPAWVAEALGAEAAARIRRCDPQPDWHLALGMPTPLAAVWTSSTRTDQGIGERDYDLVIRHQAGPVSMFTSARFDDPSVPGRRWHKENLYSDAAGEGVLIGQLPRATAMPRPVDEPEPILLPYVATPEGGRLGSLRTAAIILASGKPNNTTARTRAAVEATQRRVDTAAPLPPMTATDRADEMTIRASHKEREAARARLEGRLDKLRAARHQSSLLAALETVSDSAPPATPLEPPRAPTLPQSASAGKVGAP